MCLIGTFYITQSSLMCLVEMIKYSCECPNELAHVSNNSTTVCICGRDGNSSRTSMPGSRPIFFKLHSRRHPLINHSNYFSREACAKCNYSCWWIQQMIAFLWPAMFLHISMGNYCSDEKKHKYNILICFNIFYNT